jgi:hypothetical protein
LVKYSIESELNYIHITLFIKKRKFDNFLNIYMKQNLFLLENPIFKLTPILFLLENPIFILIDWRECMKGFQKLK